MIHSSSGISGLQRKSIKAFGDSVATSSEARSLIIGSGNMTEHYTDGNLVDEKTPIGHFHVKCRVSRGMGTGSTCGFSQLDGILRSTFYETSGSKREAVLGALAFESGGHPVMP